MRNNLFSPDREQFRAPLKQGFKSKFSAWFDALFVDFGVLRLFWKNRSRFAQSAWRMNQPLPQDIAWAKRKGIRTIITARHDGRHGGHALVAQACKKFALDYMTIPIFSREAPSREAILFAAQALISAQKPVLIHCKSGADRAGFLSALYLIAVEGRTVENAKRELSLRYLHIRASKTGILDAVFDAYLKDQEKSRKPFLDWVKDDYNSDAITRAFKHRFMADFMDRYILRHE